MIPQAHIQAWRAHAPWPNPAQVEQDLIICRALCDLFSSPALADKIAFRGGTAIHKLLFERPLRYSEDIDLVQAQAEPIGPTVDAIRDALAWLGKCNREQAGHSMHLVFRFSPESAPQATLKLKIEINTREHHTLLGYRRYPFAVDSDWYSAQVELLSFEPEELFGTKLRALLQRRKNRDLFDLHHGLLQRNMDTTKVVACLEHYLALEDHPISRAEAEERMLKKLTRSLTEDIEPLLPVGVRFDKSIAIEAFNGVWRQLVTSMRGDAWRLSAEVIEQLRSKHTGLLP